MNKTLPTKYRIKVLCKDGRYKLYDLLAKTEAEAFRTLIAIQKDLGIEVERVDEIIKIK